MSGRKKNTRGSRTSRGGRRILVRELDDDMPLSFLTLWQCGPSSMKKKRSPRKTVVKRPVAQTPTEVVNLDDTPETDQMMRNVSEKVGNFFQSGSFISSDEDEAEMIKTKTNKKPSPSQFFISDDSDDEYKKEATNTSTFQISEPSTSAGTSIKSPTKNKPNDAVDDDIMDFVDSVLTSTSDKSKERALEDMKSLEDFRKGTEEMLKNASTLLNEIKTGPEKKVEESSPKVTVGSCPICLESLASRPASVTVCGHIFCKPCITQTAQTLKKCPTCRKPLNLKKIHPIYF